MVSRLIQSVRGMNDILPDETAIWAYLESGLRHVANQYGFDEIRFPLLEQTDLFVRSVGDHTDIVEKEMFSFTARNGDQLSLRPEGTAGCVRAGIQHGLLHNQIQRLWYLGPMFRHERPQRGRARQFHQFGAEVFGIDGAAIEVELVAMNIALWRQLGLTDQITLQINSLGTPAMRAHYRDVLIQYFTEHQSTLDADSQRRLSTNPLRILDSKQPAMADVIANAPSLNDYLDDDAKAHFDTVCDLLTALNIPFTVNPYLVRGLDYYCHTVFEFVTDALGAQGTVSAGGRYDNLVEQLGGRAIPAVGFALGLERVVALLQDQQAATQRTEQQHPSVYMVMSSAGIGSGLALAHRLRSELPTLHIITDCSSSSFKSQFKRADKSTARLAIIVGDDEAAADTATIKSLRDNADQQTHPQAALVKVVKQLLNI